MEPDSSDELKARALRYLVRREHSRDELARKLSPYAASPEILEGTLDWLEITNRLSNQRFAEARAHSMARKYGAAKIRHDLTSKGIPQELAERAAAGLDEAEKAKAILARKYPAPAATRHERAKRARFLQGRGFSGDVIRRLVLQSDD